MSIEIKKNKELILDIPEFTCDNNPLGEHLNEYEMLSHLNSFSFTAIIGKPGSGKTSLLISFLTGKGNKKIFGKVFDHIHLVMPKSSRESIKRIHLKITVQTRCMKNRISIPSIQYMRATCRVARKKKRRYWYWTMWVLCWKTSRLVKSWDRSFTIGDI